MKVSTATVMIGSLVAALFFASASPTRAATLFANGFEVNNAGWDQLGGLYDATRVASGTNGIPSASGSFHAEAATGGDSAAGSAFTRWGGYNYGAGNAVATTFQEYTTSLDIYLNVGGGYANNTRFDFDSAINNAAGTFLRDFIFNAGFYNTADVTGPGAGTNRFVISASTNSQPGSAFAKNPGMAPIAISTTGWYTFKHHFYNNAGVLNVDMSIFDSSAALVNTWTRGGVDPIAGVGGNRYGWVDFNEFPQLGIDNSSLDTQAAIVPVPQAVWEGGALFLGMGAFMGMKRFGRGKQLQLA